MSDDTIFAIARELTARTQALQTQINAAGFGPPSRLSVTATRPPCCAWKATAKKYRAEATRLSICLDHTIKANESYIEQMSEELQVAREESIRLKEKLDQAGGWLLEYGGHRPDCAFLVLSKNDGCTCGYRQVIAASTGELP